MCGFYWATLYINAFTFLDCLIIYCRQCSICWTWPLGINLIHDFMAVTLSVKLGIIRKNLWSLFNCIFVFLIVCWCQKFWSKNPNMLHADILLPYTDGTSDKRPVKSVKFRKSVRECSVKFDLFKKNVKFHIFSVN